MTVAGQIIADRKSAPNGWLGILCYGILLTALGILALFRPLAADLATGLLLSMVLIIGGIVGLAAGFTTNGWHHRWVDSLVGLFSLGFGILILWHPLVGAFSLLWAVGLWLLLCGGAEVAAGWKPAYNHPWLLLLGAFNILLGLYLVFAGPAAALVILAVMVAISFLARGVTLTVFALQLRGAAR